MVEWYVYALLSAVIGGVISVVDKKILKRVSVIDFSVMHAFGAFLLSLSLLFFFDIKIDHRTALLIFVASVFSCLGFYLVNKALKKYDVSLVSPLRSFNPVVLMVLAFLFLDEMVTAYNILGILLIAAGAYVIEARDILHKPFQPLKNMFKSSLMVLILLSAVFYGISSTIDKMVLSSYDVFSFIVVIHFFLALNFLVINIVEHRHVLSWNRNVRSVLPLVALAAIVAFASRTLLLQSIAIGLVSLAIAVKHTDGLFSTILGGQLFHEKHLKKKLVAAGIMFIGVLLVVLKI